MIVRREVIEAAGLLCDRFFMYGEDIEWCWRIRKAGWRIGMCGGLAFQHGGSESATKTWGVQERNLRILRGEYEACRRMRGGLYARFYIAANILAVWIESVHPLRARPWRDNMKVLLNNYVKILNET